MSSIEQVFALSEPAGPRGRKLLLDAMRELALLRAQAESLPKFDNVRALIDLGEAIKADRDTRRDWDHEVEHTSLRYPKGADKRLAAIHRDRVRAGKRLKKARAAVDEIASRLCRGERL